MDTIQNKTVAGTTAIKNNTYDNNIVRRIPQFIKSRVKLCELKVKAISFSLWRINYELEEARQDHAARGHLWRQIGYCIVLLAFRIAGKVVR